MSDPEIQTSTLPSMPAETDRQRAVRIQREAAIIAAGEAQIDEGLGIDDGQLEAWLDVLEHHANAPLPPPNRHRFSAL